MAPAHSLSRLIVRAVLVLLPLLAQAAQAQNTNRGIPLYLDLYLNEVRTGKLIEVRDRDGELYLQPEQIARQGLRLDGAPDGWTEVSQLPGVTARYNEANQSLHITARPDLYPEQRLTGLGIEALGPAIRDFGALLNYDLYAARDPDTTTFSAGTELRVFGNFGVVSSTGVYRYIDRDEAEDDSDFTRLNTTWSYSDTEDLVSYRLGDVITGTPNWAPAVRLGGIQISRNFSLRPDLVTYPLPEFSGEATVPSSVEVLINESRVFSDEVNPGPFVVETAPYINGAGEAEVVVTDALGRRVSTTLSIYLTNRLLRRGLFNFSVEAGFLREHFGQDSFNYDENPAGSGTVAYGVTDWLTVEGHSEATHDLANTGVGAIAKLWTYGEVNFSYAGSVSDLGYGNAYSIGYRYANRRFSFSAQRSVEDSSFATLGSPRKDSGALKSDRRVVDQVTGSLSFDRYGSLSGGYYAIESSGGGRDELLNLSYSVPLWHGASLFANLSQSLGGDNDTSGNVAISFPLGASMTGSLRGVRTSSDQRYAVASVNRPAPLEGGFGWNASVAAGDVDFQQGDFNWRNRYNHLYVGASRRDGDTTVWTQARGALVTMDGHVMAANQINDAFALVDTDGLAEVPVKLENRLIGTTDSDGILLVPGLTSYNRNRVSIDTLNLPVDVRVDDVSQNVVLADRSGARVVFAAETPAAAVLILTDDNGAPLEPGAVAYLEGAELESYVGWDGRLYLEGLGAENTLVIERADAAPCQIDFTFTPVAGEQQTLGPFQCVN